MKRYKIEKYKDDPTEDKDGEWVKLADIEDKLEPVINTAIALANFSDDDHIQEMALWIADKLLSAISDDVETTEPD